MKHIIKKILYLFLSASVLILTIPTVTANAAQEMWLDGEENGFEYSIQLNYGYAVITGYDADKKGIVEIPSEILGNPVTTIGKSAFQGCGKTDEEYEADEIELEYRHGCSGCEITEIIIPDSVINIEDFAFKDCESITKIHFPSGLKDFYGSENNRYDGENIGYSSWIEGCNSLRELTISENNPYYKSVNGIIYNKDGKTIGPVPPAITFDSINFDGISAIGDFAFCGRESQKSDIKIPSNITSIGNYAFCGYGGSWYDKDNDNVINIKLNDRLTTIGDYEFSKMYYLKEIELPDSILSIGKGAFASDTQLKSIIIPPKVKVISDSLFENCLNLESVAFPNSITEIGKWAFYGPLNLTDIQLPTSLKKIGDYAFCYFQSNQLSNLTSIIIPDSVEYIGKYAFKGNGNLKYVKLSKNLKEIESYFFSECGIDILEIPEGVTEIGEEAFSYNTLTSLKLPDTLLKIGDDAFLNGFALYQGYGITAKKFVEIPNSVTEIGAAAFEGCSLSDVKLPDTPVYCDFLLLPVIVYLLRLFLKEQQV